MAESNNERGIVRRFFEDVLERPIWQFISVLVGLLAIFIAIALDIQNNSQKEISVTVLDSASLVEIDNNFSNDIDVYYKEQEINNLSFILISISNSGSSEILSADFERPLALSLPPESSVVEVITVSEMPDTLMANVSHDIGNVFLSPLLLNPTDRLLIRVLVLDVPEGDLLKNIRVDARIAGIPDVTIDDAREIDSPSIFLFNFFAVSSIIQFFIILGFLLSRPLVNRLFAPERQTEILEPEVS